MLQVHDSNGFLKIGGVQSIQDDRFNITGSADVTKRIRFEVDGLTTGTTRTITAPDADIEIQGTHDVISTNWTARNHGAYTLIASGTATDPGTPSPGHEFTTLVRNGTATIGGTAYATSGSIIRRVYHSGSWTNYVYPHLDGAWTWTAAQAFRANGSHFFGIVATTGLTNVTADGGNSGANGGASFFVRGNGATTAAWGNFSSILGGAYDVRTTIYSAASNIVFQHGGTTAATLDTSGNLGIGGTGTVSRLLVVQSADTSNPGIRIQRAADDSVIQFGYRSGTDSWETSATYATTGSYKPLTWKTSDILRMTLDLSGNLGIGVTPTAGNGLLQFASGTTKANGIAFGTDTFLYRNGSNSLITDGALAAKGDINILKSAGTDAQFLIQVSGTGSIQFGLNKSGSTNATGAADGEMYFGSNGAFPISITSGGTRRIRIGTGGELHLFGGTPVARPTYGAPTGTATRTAFDTATVTLAQLAERVKAMIDDNRSRGDYA